MMNMNRRLLPRDNRCVCPSSSSLIFLHILSPPLSLPLASLYLSHIYPVFFERSALDQVRIIPMNIKHQTLKELAFHTDE